MQVFSMGAAYFVVIEVQAFSFVGIVVLVAFMLNLPIAPNPWRFFSALQASFSTT
jgi:hypothetical protein